MVTDVWNRDGDSGTHTVLRGDSVERKNTGQEWSKESSTQASHPTGSSAPELGPQEMKTGLTHLFLAQGCSLLATGTGYNPIEGVGASAERPAI